jgi:hypothetical protein
MRTAADTRGCPHHRFHSDTLLIKSSSLYRRTRQWARPPADLSLLHRGGSVGWHALEDQQTDVVIGEFDVLAGT